MRCVEARGFRNQTETEAKLPYAECFLLVFGQHDRRKDEIYLGWLDARSQQ